MSDKTELSEVTAKILKPYVEKAKQQLKPSKPGRPSKEFTERKAKREQGIAKASSKINMAAIKLRNQMSENHKERIQDIHNEFHKVAPKILKDHGFNLTSDHSDRTVWTKVDPNHGHIHFAVLSKKKPDDFGHSAATALIGSTSGYSASRHNVYVPYVDDNHDETKNRVTTDFEKALKDSKDYTARNIYEGVEELDEKLQGNQKKIDMNNNNKLDSEDFRILRKKKMKEETVDEATLSAKSARAGKDIGAPGKTFGKIAKEAGKRYESKAAGERVAGAILKKMRANEEVEELEEGRGRPPKEGSEAWKRRQAAAEKGEDEGDSKHIIDDLRKASTNIKGEGPVRFKNGTTNVQRGHAIRILAKYMRQEKPADKEAMQDRISNSYEHLQKEL